MSAGLAILRDLRIATKSLGRSTGFTVLGCADVAAHPESDAPTGCRQMIGNVWE